MNKRKLHLFKEWQFPLVFSAFFSWLPRFTGCDLAAFWKRQEPSYRSCGRHDPTRFFLYPKNPSAPFLYHTDVCDWYRTGSVFRHCGCSLCRGKPEISGSFTADSPNPYSGSPFISSPDSGADCHFFVRAWEPLPVLLQLPCIPLPL